MKPLVSIRSCAMAAFLAGAVLATRAAEDPETSTATGRFLPWEKGAILFGGFVAQFDSTLGFGVDNGANVTLNAEDILGLDSRLTVFRAEAMFRPGSSLRHQLDFSYASYDRDGTATLSEEITIGDVTYPVGAQVESVFDFDIIRGTYSYAFLQTERVRLGLGLGVYAVPLRYSLDGETTGGHTVVEGAKTTLPLPALALRSEFQLVPRLFLNASANGMYLEVSEFQGWMADINVGLEYRPWKHVGLGLGYNFMAVNVEAAGSSSDYPGADFVGSVDVRFSGLLLYGKLSF